MIDFNDNKVIAQGCAAAGVLGVASHLLYFMHGEHDRYAHRWIFRTLAGIGLLAAGVFHVTEKRAVLTAGLTSALTASFVTGLFGSISVYRLFLHRLGRFPGPFWSRLSNFRHMYVIRNSDNYLYVQKLHKKHGQFIRTGPSTMSITHPDAIKTVLGNSSKCVKGAWYERSLPLVSLQTVRDKKKHDARRKVFSKAFSPSAMVEYERRIVLHCEEFVRQMKKISGKPFNASNWCKFFAFDVMGDVGLGKEFHMMTTEKNRWIPDLLETSFASVGPTMQLPWMGSIIMRIPGAGKYVGAWLEFVGSQVKERVEKHVERADVLAHLVDAYNESEKKDIDYQWLRGDTRLTIVGGSDTTASTLTYIFHHLAKNPDQWEKLRAELEPLLDGKNVLEKKDVSKAQHLDGIVQEALRLHPAIPSGFPRITPAEGITIDGTFIPGGTTIFLPPYTMQRDELNYERPEEFIPERWYSQPELIKNKEAFITWNIGMNGCIGRGLAISEMKNMLTHIVANFKSIRHAPGEDGSDLLLKTLDHFTVGVVPMYLIFEEK
ncbi:related to pisatin demethylase cytochrome P450 [Cephalotrichum gorgonifer]|uniref:Related to pisatin demethylase cytochrome P450 n=1 Tax=Cephalotrichum gorgonifer TaxID=2041049 RepID=A0AAE8N8W5_9PEZI|nr:related to pisatin demethylase cytochrome P450 [Cephalotrichum gorgonifer]